ncbi:MAG: ribosome small subunit-dependent GTPase A, partial [Acidobacteriota bacterium]
SYDDPDTAAVINELYVAVKVDRDERPDVDARYQRAVQSLVGQGGWPLTVFLTPTGEVFHGGTYFPPGDAHGRPAFRRVLREVARVWADERERVETVVSAVRERLEPGRTVALLGSSGVGKSTLVNVLAGQELLRTREVRKRDDRGRHTTTHRELFRLPGGALVVDTPGMRELGVAGTDAGLGEAFDDVEELAASCRFRDCTHTGEPACAVREALESGELDPKRWESYLKLQRELAYRERRVDDAKAREEKRRWKRIHRQFRKDPEKGR